MTRFFLTVLVIFTFIYHVLAAPSCVEDGKEYLIEPQKSFYGTISTVSGHEDSEALSLRIKSDPEVTVTAAEHWSYSVSPSSVESFSLAVEALDGDEVVCEATIRYITAPVTRELSPVSCGEPVTVTYTPGHTHSGELPVTIPLKCDGKLKTKIEQPSLGIAAPYGTWNYVYGAPALVEDASTTLNFQISCVTTDEVLCSGTVQINLHEDSPACPNNKISYNVLTSSSTTENLPIGTSCDDTMHMVVKSSNQIGVMQLGSTGTSFTYTAPSVEKDGIFTMRIYCYDTPLCDADVVFATFKEFPTNTPAPSSSSSTSTSTSTVVPTSTKTPLSNCSKSSTFKVPTGQNLYGSLDILLPTDCEIITYKAASGTPQGKFSVNIIGDFLYQAPTFETIETATVEVSCITTPSCNTEVTFVSYYPQEDTTTTTTSPQVPIAPCANIYYYETSVGVALSDTLKGIPGQETCLYGRQFFIAQQPQAGTVNLMANGDFSFSPPSYEGQYDFKFTMWCQNQIACSGFVYLQVKAVPKTTESPDGNNSNIVTNPKIKCAGSCKEKPWLTYPNAPLWDNSPSQLVKRADDQPVDGISVSWSNSALIFTVYSLIGNLGVRFPTFEAITSRNYFESKDVLSTVAASSPGFEPTCLDNQGRAGMGEDVWKWKTLSGSNGTGAPGNYYASGSSWYQKFGGKHDKCDTFANSCLYAPLLTPSNQTSPVSWNIDINNCDATWTGVIPYNRLNELKAANGSQIWQFIDKHQIKGTLITEAVRAHSWAAPGRFDSTSKSHDIIISLEQFVTSKKATDNAVFSVDVEFFTYQVNETGDLAFGINMLLHPFVTSDMETSYAKDRHVVGFKWSEQEWNSPNKEDCPSCTGSRTKCTSASQLTAAAYKGAFPQGDCPTGTARIELVKGPMTTEEQCPFKPMHVYNQSGFSPSTNCQTTFQNITLRGIAAGSSGLTEMQRRQFHYEGMIGLELLTEDGNKHALNLNLSMFVSRLSQDLSVANGGLRVCRAGNYWPVLDPLGVSLPDQKFDLSVSETTELCVDDLSSTYGPSDWVLFTLNLPNRAYDEVTVNYIYLVYNDTRIYLLYRDSVTGALVVPPEEAGMWWQYVAPFVAYRPISYRTGNLTTSKQMANSSSVQNVTKAFMFMPGALPIDGNVELVVSATVNEDSSYGPTTFRRILNIDPLLTQLSRQGPAVTPEKKGSQEKENFYAIGVLAGVSVVLVVTVIFFMLADNNRPLPKWIPRGKLVKETVLSVLPGGKKTHQHKEKPAVHKDMYAAMKSGKY